ncbi:MAG: M42 family metallopeptidase [Anaerolineae bacterium]
MEIGPLLKKISSAAGISGYEDEVRQAISEEFGRWADELRADRLGNLITLKRGEGNAPRRSIMLAAHMDEIGLIVTKIEEGFLHFGTVGGFDQRVLPGQEVVVHGRRALPGVIGMRPPHLLPPEEREKVIPLEDLRIDLGLPNEEVAKLVRAGDLITMRREFLELGGELASGQAFDDRAGVVSLAVCLEHLSGLRHAWDVYAVATSQEEVGLRGAMVSAYGLVPDLAIAVDVGFAHSPGLSEAETISLKKGPAIALGPNFHPALHEALVKTAQELEIPYQIEAIPGRSGTDAWAIQVAREGIPTALLSIPLRYMHTAVETVSLKDIERAGRLIAHFIARLDEEFMAKIPEGAQSRNK